MGIYLNTGIKKFQQSLCSEIYVDKTGLIACTNKVLGTRQKYLCVSRPRRFGKSMAAEMLAAYYSYGCDSGKDFQSLEIAEHPSFEEQRNKYDTIFINMQEFLSRTKSVPDMLDLLKRRVLWELMEAYPDFRYFDKTDLISTMQDVYQYTKRPFVVIIDEWDCIFRQ